MSLPETLTRLAALKRLRELVAAEEAALREDAQAQLDHAYQSAGADRFTIQLPDGTKVATATRTQPATDTTPTVTNMQAFAEYVGRHYPDEVEFAVRPAFAKQLLNQPYDPETGEIIPGITFTETARAPGMQLRYTPTGRDDIATAWRGGHLTPLLQLSSHHEGDSP